MDNTNLLNLNDFELFKEGDELYLLIDGVKWFFADEILKDIPEPQRRAYINTQINCYNKLIVKYNDGYSILISHNKQNEIKFLNSNHLCSCEMIINKNKKSHSPKDIKNLYVLESEDHVIKIGITSNLYTRKKSLQSVAGRKFINEYMTELCYNAYEIESEIKKELKKYNISGEWFNIEFSKMVKIVQQKFNSKAILL